MFCLVLDASRLVNDQPENQRITSRAPGPCHDDRASVWIWREALGSKTEKIKDLFFGLDSCLGRESSGRASAKRVRYLQNPGKPMGATISACSRFSTNRAGRVELQRAVRNNKRELRPLNTARYSANPLRRTRIRPCHDPNRPDTISRLALDGCLKTAENDSISLWASPAESRALHDACGTKGDWT